MAIYYGNKSTGRVERILEGPEVYERILKRYDSKAMARKKASRRTKTIQQMDSSKHWQRLSNEKGAAALKRWSAYLVEQSAEIYADEADTEAAAQERAKAEAQRLDRTNTPRRSEGGESANNVASQIFGE
jgi:hypothetical protein